MLETPKEHEQKEEEPAESKTVGALPTFVTYQKTYANSCGNLDQKALKLFKEYESAERVRRLRGEMMAVSQGNASDELCDRVVGKNRKAKFGSYEKWARMMLAQLQLK